MARTPIIVTNLSRDGVDEPDFTTGYASNGWEIEITNNNSFLVVKNIGGATQTLEIPLYKTLDFIDVERTIHFAAGVTKYIGMFPKVTYSSPTDSLILVDSASDGWQFQAFEGGHTEG